MSNPFRYILSSWKSLQDVERLSKEELAFIKSEASREAESLIRRYGNRGPAFILAVIQAIDTQMSKYVKQYAAEIKAAQNKKEPF